MGLRIKIVVSAFILGELATTLYMGGVAEAALATGISYLLFPELAALSYAVFTRPRGVWARAPLLMVVTPLLTAVLGILIERHIAYGFVSIFISVASSLLLIRILKSPVAPAISAGLLPIALNEGSWWYPASVAFGTGFLVLGLFAYRAAFPSAVAELHEEPVTAPPTNHRKSAYYWLPFYLMFLVFAAGLVTATNARFILFPPLLVIGFEMFAHSETCPWAGRPIILPVICTFAALSGTILDQSLGSTPLAAVVAVLIGIGLCRVFRLHVPPAIAVGLLPFVISNPNFWFPLAVAIGTLLLTGTFHLYRFFSYRALTP